MLPARGVPLAAMAPPQPFPPSSRGTLVSNLVDSKPGKGS